MSSTCARDPIQWALEENNLDWYRDLVEHSHDLLCIHDLQGRLLAVNPLPARLLGYSVEEILQIPLREIIAPEFRDQFDLYLKQIERHGEAHGLMAVAGRSGERRIWDYHNTLRTTGVAAPVVRGIAHDVTEQRQAEAKFRGLLEAAPDAMVVVDAEGRIVLVNAQVERMFGYQCAELLGQRIEMLVPERLRERHVKLRTDVMRAPLEMPMGGSREFLGLHRDGHEFPVEINLSPLKTAGGLLVTSAIRDITERRLAEAALETSERKLRALYELSPIGVVVADPTTGRFLQVNARFCEIVGRTETDLLAQSFPGITHPDDIEGNLAQVARLTAREVQQVALEKRYIRPDGSVRLVTVELVRLWAEGESPVVAMVQDITERRRAEQALRESEARERARAKELETVLDVLPIPMVIAHDAECRHMTANRRGREHLRLEPGANVSMSAPASERPRLRFLRDGVEIPVEELPMQRAAATGRPVYEMPTTVVFEDGTERHELTNAVPLLDENGKVRGAVGAAVDITERKRADEQILKGRAELENSRANIAALFESVTDMIWSADRQYRLLTFNTALAENFRKNYGTEARVGAAPEDLLPPDRAAKWPLLYERVFTEGAFSQEYSLPDGRVLEIALSPMRRGGEAVGVSVFGKDITERKRAEEDLRTSEQRQRLALKVGQIGAFNVNLQNDRGAWTPELATIWGLPSDFEGDLATFCWEHVHPADLARVRSEFVQIAQSGNESEMEFRIVRTDASIRWIRCRGQMIQDLPASFRAVGVVMDITERKRSEEAIATLVQQVRADSSESFFSSMACQLCKCLGADYTFIGELVGGEVEKVKTVAVCQHEMPADNFTYELAGTPCAGVMNQRVRTYVSGVARLFPADPLVKEMEIEGYTGTPLFNSQGRAIGIMVALYRRPVDDPRFAESILQLFSARTAAEIERNRTEEALRTSEERLRVALKSAPIKVFHQDREHRYTWAHNLSGGWAERDFLGNTDEEIFEPETAARIKALKQAVLETGEGKREVLTLTAHGEISHCDVTVEPLRDAAGNVVGVNSACIDVSHLQKITEDLRQATGKLAEEKFYLEQEIDTELGFKEIVGQSAALKEVMEQVGKVAASDATVLLLGETGTGKELVARALHRLSRRAGNSFIKMNCAAIPSGLLESELFGYEKGAFTGAIGKKLGRLELADKGTLFLDEIGEIPLALQPKLLRVLQDQEFERLGGTQTLKVDFRLIAATNRDLAEGVKKGEFRSDLYYRLNVFPVRVPPLRERREDIRLLVEHFVQKCAKRMNRKITSIPKKTIDALTGWDWPGNVRELENFVERSVILTQGSVLVSPLSELKPPSEGAMNDTLEAAEREHILRALCVSRGQIGGPRGAAARLGLKRTTLQSKLKQMGIDRRPSAAGN